MVNFTEEQIPLLLVVSLSLMINIEEEEVRTNWKEVLFIFISEEPKPREELHWPKTFTKFDGDEVTFDSRDPRIKPERIQNNRAQDVPAYEGK